MQPHNSPARFRVSSAETLNGEGARMTFEEFAAARLPALLRYAVMLTGDRELAQDVVQEVMIRAHGRWWRIRRADRPDLYVRRMVTNEFISTRRRRALRTVPLEHLTAGPVHPDHADAATDSDELWLRLADLPRQQRAVLVLRYYEGLPDTEIADVLGCSSGTVRGYASRALATLRLELAESSTSTGGDQS
jgi:RNA polymerase sigma-70 factor (sigma-E family)